MTKNATGAAYDLVLTGARVCDPATSLDCNCDLLVNGDRIDAVGSRLPPHAREVIELDGKLVTAGWVNLVCGGRAPLTQVRTLAACAPMIA